MGYNEENSEEKQLTNTENNAKQKFRHEYQKKRVIIPSVTAVILLFTGILAAVHSTYFQSTDDAFVEGRLITIAPRVDGSVVNLLVDDNDDVKAGELLAEIDPRYYEVKLRQAKAKLAQAKAQLYVNGYEVEKNISDLNLSVKDVNTMNSKLDFAREELQKSEHMYKGGNISKQDYDNSRKELEVLTANHKSAKEKFDSAKLNLKSAKAKNEMVLADIKRLEAEVEQAELELSYTKIYAPQSGRIASRSVEQGNYVQTGQPLMHIVSEDVWIVANFKEIQLTNMKPHQPVSIKIDTYPGKNFKGEVHSIQKATGAKVSLFPPENAVGSYVKIVQRIPVKIVFTEDVSNYNIVPGMSVVPKVKVK